MGMNNGLPAILDPLTGPPPGFNPADANNRYQQIGTPGNNIVGQVDVRTPQMIGLEQAAFPLLAQILQNPASIAQGIQGIAGQAPGAASFGANNPAFAAMGQRPSNPLLDLLLGGSTANAPQTPQTPSGGSTGGSGGSGAGSGTGSGGGGGTGPRTGPPILGSSQQPQLTQQPSPQGVDPAYIQQPGQTAQQLYQQQLQSGAISPSTAPPGNPNAPAPTFTPPSYTQDLQKLQSENAPQLGPAQTIANYLWQQLQSGAQSLGPNFNAGASTGYGSPQEQLNQLTMMAAGTPQGQAQLLGSFGIQDLGGFAQAAGLAPGYFNGIAPVQYRAQGGLLDPNAFTVVGENGPELIPPGNNQVIPLNGGAVGTSPAAPSSAPTGPLVGPGTPTPMRTIDPSGLPQFPLMNTAAPAPGIMQTTALNTPLRDPGISIGDGGPAGGGSGGSPNQTLGGGGGISIPNNNITNPSGSDALTPNLGGGVSIPNNDITNPPGTNIANPGTFPQSPQQGPGTGVLAQMLNQNPEVQAYNTANNFTQGLLGTNPGQGVVNALQPVFQQNLTQALGQLRNTAPSAFNSGLALQGTDLSQKALNDFNLLASQALQQGVNQQLQGLGTLGGLASAAGQNPFQRALGAAGVGLQQQQQDIGRELGLMNLAQQQQQFNSQFGLAQQAQNYNQTINPTLQLLLAALGQATPTGLQTVIFGDN